MRKLLQVLTVILFLLSAGALALGIMLFSKRELLKSRTQALEKAVVGLSALLETPTDPDVQPNTFPEKDIGTVTAQLVAEPERSSIWADYPKYLEEPDRPFATIRREDLMYFYKVNPITGKPEKDAATGLKITTGDGTMDATLTKVREAAQYELDRLNQTRHQLQRMREELVQTIQDLNDGKQRLRQSLVTIQDQKGQIATLEDNKRALEAQVASLENERTQLQEQIADLDRQIAEKDEEIKLRDDTIASQRQQIADLKLQGDRNLPGVIGGGVIERTVEAGLKGEVLSVNPDWSYVVLQLNDQFLSEFAKLQEALEKNGTPGIPSVEMFLKRGDSYVTKIKLVQVKLAEKLAIADVLVDWQQGPVAAGDLVYY